MRKASVKRASQENGIVLVIVLWIITLLSIMAGSFAYSMRTETALATSAVERAQLHALAEAGVSYAILHIVNPSASEEWPLDGRPIEWRFGAGRVRISTVSSSGKIDLNRGNRELLGGLLASTGVPEEEIDKLLDAIEDWRDPDDLRRLNGAEIDDYHAAGRSSGPRNEPFESVEELQQVLGMTQEIYRRIAGELTVYSRQPGIDPATASATALRAIPGIDQAAVDEYIKLREENAAEGLPPPPPPLSSPYLSQGRTLAYHISVKAFLDSGYTAVVEAIVSPGIRHGLPYHQLAWREGT